MLHWVRGSNWVLKWIPWPTAIQYLHPCILDRNPSRLLPCGIELEWTNFIYEKTALLLVDDCRILWLLQSSTRNTNCVLVAEGLPSGRRLSGVSPYRVNPFFIWGLEWPVNRLTTFSMFLLTHSCNTSSWTLVHLEHEKACDPFRNSLVL